MSKLKNKITKLLMLCSIWHFKAPHLLAQLPHEVHIEQGKFHNLYRVDSLVYRCEQPGKHDMQTLENLGVKTVLNLRVLNRDKRLAKKTGLMLIHLPIWTSQMDEHDIRNILNIIDTCAKPMAIHCLHGADRTGVAVSSYYMFHYNVSRQQAIEAFLLPQYGYHQKMFPGLLKLLEQVDLNSK